MKFVILERDIDMCLQELTRKIEICLQYGRKHENGMVLVFTDLERKIDV